MKLSYIKAKFFLCLLGMMSSLCAGMENPLTSSSDDEGTFQETSSSSTISASYQENSEIYPLDESDPSSQQNNPWERGDQGYFRCQDPVDIGLQWWKVYERRLDSTRMSFEDAQNSRDTLMQLIQDAKDYAMHGYMPCLGFLNRIAVRFPEGKLAISEVFSFLNTPESYGTPIRFSLELKQEKIHQKSRRHKNLSHQEEDRIRSDPPADDSASRGD